MWDPYNQNSTHPSLYAQVTEKIIAELERGIVPWVQPWSTLGGDGGVSASCVA